ncbi:MAG: hypothetical protein N2167_10920 [Flavobacteriales bacterium]|nr:hypothetical protein [Flavobacteriales bacterium]
MAAFNEKKQYSKNEYLSHREVVKLLADLRGFRVQKDNLPSMTSAHVGMTEKGELVYIEYIIGPGDSYVVTFMRPAKKIERDYYFQGDHL